MQRWLTSGDPILEAEARSRLSAPVIESKIPVVEFTPEPMPETLSECDRNREDTFPTRLDILDLSDVLTEIDCERARLRWRREDLQQYCLNQYGQIRSSLTDDELISLLLTLRQMGIDSD